MFWNIKKNVSPGRFIYLLLGNLQIGVAINNQTGTRASYPQGLFWQRADILLKAKLIFIILLN